MTKQEILEPLQQLDQEQQLQWMLSLGYHLTVSARASYPSKENPGNLNALIGFNEIQHQVYGRIRTIGRGGAWTLESFFDGLLDWASTYGVQGDLGWALMMSLPKS